ncbi:MAG: DUF418 domain-containing protein [Luteitalea sp.]|nr:DUF418 domain-containing protein [Luteitalea sp.]
MLPSTPISAPDRQLPLDALRGFALLGILMMNIRMFSMPFAAYFNPTAYGSLDGLNYWVWFVGHVFFDQKFMTIFSMLFGAGIVLMTGRAEARGDGPAMRHYRRMCWLLVFGLVHAYGLWSGDILVLYALCGAWVFLLRRRSPRTLLVLGALVLAIGSLLSVGAYAGMQYLPPEEVAGIERELGNPQPEDIARELAAYRSGWWGQMPDRAKRSLEFHLQVFWLWGLWRAGGLMLVGMALFKLGVFSGRSRPQLYVAFVASGALIGLPLVLASVHDIELYDWGSLRAFFVDSQWNYWGSVFVSLGYVGLVMLVVTRGILAPLVARLAAVGRMALTNYLLHTLICTTVFYGHGLGYFGYFSRTDQALLVVAIWLIQLVVSPLWLRRFEFGPFEWLWRALTYGQAPPFRRAPSQVATGVA